MPKWVAVRKIVLFISLLMAFFKNQKPNLTRMKDTKKCQFCIDGITYYNKMQAL
jgi:hypothetical protein